MPRPHRRLTRRVALALTLAPSLAAVPVTNGPAKCTQCHDHERQTTQWRTTEPALGKGKAHVNALKRLDDPKAARYARAIQLADPYDLKGSCVRCHATVFRGDARAGVSCESCHGPAGSYEEPHQQKGSYTKAVGLGMRDLRQQPEAIGRLCAECHRVEDRRLVTEGHPDGASWDAAAAFGRIAHWTAGSDAARVAAAARARTGPAPAPASTAALAAPGAARPAPAPATTAKPAAPWDWSQPVAALPADYEPEPVAAAAPAAASSPNATTAAPRARPEAAVPPSIAEERPTVPVGNARGAPAIEPVQVTRLVAATAASGAGPEDVATRRGRALRALEALLRRGAKIPGSPPPRPPAEPGGPDSELLRLQEEALVLALEALRRP